MVIKLYIIKLL